MLQLVQVGAYGRCRLAKNDRIDAAMVAGRIASGEIIRRLLIQRYKPLRSTTIVTRSKSA